MRLHRERAWQSILLPIGEIFLDLKLLEIKPGESDRRLESWLDSIDRIGYVTEPDKIVFHE